MRIYKKPYLGTSIKNYKKLIEDIKSKKPLLGYYVICVKDGAGILTIFSVGEFLKQEGYIIVGISMGKVEAFNLTRHIIENHFKKFRNFKNFSDIYSNKTYTAL